MNDHLTERELARYFIRRRAGGRGRLARGMDYVLIRLILLIGAYLFFSAKLPGGGWRVSLLSGVFLLLCMLLMRILRELAMERFTRRETVRIRRVLLTDRLLLLSSTQANALCAPLCKSKATPVLLQRVRPADADALLAAIRGRRGPLTVFSCSGFDASAEAMAARAGGLLTLYPQGALFDAADKAGLSPTEGDVRAYIAGELARARTRRRAARPRPFAQNRAGKYLLVALALTVVSFFTRYTLYYRLLAGLCTSIATAGFLLNRTHPEGS